MLENVSLRSMVCDILRILLILNVLILIIQSNMEILNYFIKSMLVNQYGAHLYLILIWRISIQYKSLIYDFELII